MDRSRRDNALSAMLGIVTFRAGIYSGSTATPAYIHYSASHVLAAEYGLRYL